ncbi:MAG: hypothetical protein IJ870_01730 [Alphaproteobacteria bacterium]|nr:hypothetical protein [Alphaproteobacteria bacterium]
MKHNFLSLILAGTIISGTSLSANTVFAQENLPAEAPKMEHHFNREDFQKKMAEKIAKDLNLTPEQQEQAAAIREAGKQEIEPMMNEMNALRERIDAKRRANMEEFENILTPEQKEKFEQIKQKAPRHNFRGGIRAPQHEENMAGPRHHGPHMGPRGAHIESTSPAEIEVIDAQEVVVQE